MEGAMRCTLTACLTRWREVMVINIAISITCLWKVLHRLFFYGPILFCVWDWTFFIFLGPHINIETLWLATHIKAIWFHGPGPHDRKTSNFILLCTKNQHLQHGAIRSAQWGSMWSMSQMSSTLTLYRGQSQCEAWHDW